MLDQPGKDDAGEERFAGAGGAEDAGGALDELFKVQANRQALLASVADDEVALFRWVAEDGRYIAGLGAPHQGMMRRDGFNRDGCGVDQVRLAPGGVARAAWIGSDLEHQRGQHFQVGVERLPVEQRGRPWGRRVSLCSSAKRGSVAPSCRSVTRP